MLAAPFLDNQQQVDFPTSSFCFLVFSRYHLLSISTHHLPQKGFAQLWSCAFLSITLLQKFQTSAYSPGRTCSTGSPGPCLARGLICLFLFINGSSSVWISGFWFVAVQGGCLFLELVLLTGRSVTRRVEKRNPIVAMLPPDWSRDNVYPASDK